MAERSFANPADEEPEEPDVRDWFDQEPVLGKTAWLTVRRLARRASSSWVIWLSACVVVSGGLAAWRALRPSFSSSTVLLRVTEGTVELPGSELRSGELKLFVDSLVFTAENLRALMRRHAAKFPEVDQDPVTALHAFRDHLEVNISGNDLIEDEPFEERRSARIAVSFEAVDRNEAWEVAKELADLIIDVSVTRQRRTLEREEAGALAASQGAASLGPPGLPTPVPVDGVDPAPNSGASLLRKAQKAGANADVGLRALEQGQLLSFSLIDAGHPALPGNPLLAVLSTFFIALAATAAAACLLAGVSDPRVVNEEDMGSIGMPILARFPAIPRRRGSR